MKKVPVAKADVRCPADKNVPEEPVQGSVQCQREAGHKGLHHWKSGDPRVPEVDW